MVLFFVSVNRDAISESAYLGHAQCEKVITESAITNVVRDVFENKTRQLARDGLLSDEFWSKNKNLTFSVCDNRASYDTRIIYGKGIIFDYQMIGFLFAQSRALMVGNYISQEKQFDVHAELVRQFVQQSPAVDAGPLAIVKGIVRKIKKDKATYDSFVSDLEYGRRERKLFRQAMYFLVMHERCHVALDHGTRRDEIEKLDDRAQQAALHQMELDADRCALDIMNLDELRYKGSPISYFGALMTVATQAIVANHAALASQKTHPSTVVRMSAAKKVTLNYLARQDSEKVRSYSAIIEEVAAYFDELLSEFRR